MPDFIIVRHGETQWNVEKRHLCWLNSPLTSEGIKQADRLGAYFKKSLGQNKIWPINTIYASDLGRIRQTVDIINIHLGNVPVKYDKLLREHNMGDFDGLTLEEVEKACPGFTEKRNNNKWEVRPPHGENYMDVLNRAKPLIAEIAKKHADKETVLIVAHRAVNKLLVKLSLNLSIEETNNLKTLSPGEGYLIQKNKLSIINAK